MVVFVLALLLFAMVVLTYLLFVVTFADLNAFWGKQYVFIFRHEDWSLYKFLLKHQELYAVYLNADYDIVYNKRPFSIIICSNGNYGLFREESEHCEISNSSGGQFLLDDLIANSKYGVKWSNKEDAVEKR